MKQEPYSNSSRPHTPQGKMLFRQSRWGRWPLILLGIVALLVVVLIASFLMRFPQLQQHLELGEKYLNELNYSSAVMEFTSAIEVDSRNEDAYLGRGEAYLGLGDFGSAIDDYTMVIYLNSSTIDGYVGRSRARAAQGEQAEAEEDLQMAIANGLDEAQAEIIRQENTAPAEPLTAEDVVWLVEPSYDYMDISPLPVDADTFWAWHEASFSPLPQYYQAVVRTSEYGFYAFDVIDMDTQETLAETASEPQVYAFYPSVVASEAPYLDLGDMGNVENIYSGRVISPTFADGNYVFGDMMGAFNRTEFVLDISSELFYGESYNIISGPPWTEFTTFSDVVQQIGLQKPVPVFRWDLSSAAPITPGASYLPAEYYTPGDPDIPITAEPDRSAYAFLSPEGQLITGFAYEDVVDFSEGVAAVKQNGKWAYLDERGTPITEFAYDGVWTASGSEQLWKAFPCTCDTIVVSQNGQMGLLYRDGSVLINFGEFEDLAPAYNDQLWAKQNGLWGLVDLADVKRQTNHS